MPSSITVTDWTHTQDWTNRGVIWLPSFSPQVVGAEDVTAQSAWSTQVVLPHLGAEPSGATDNGWSWSFAPPVNAGTGVSAGYHYGSIYLLAPDGSGIQPSTFTAAYLECTYAAARAGADSADAYEESDPDGPDGFASFGSLEDSFFILFYADGLGNANEGVGGNPPPNEFGTLDVGGHDPSYYYGWTAYLYGMHPMVPATGWDGDPSAAWDHSPPDTTYDGYVPGDVTFTHSYTYIPPPSISPGAPTSGLVPALHHSS
jgi:hypothetical protein